MTTKQNYITPIMERVELKFEAGILSYSEGNGEASGEGMYTPAQEAF